MYLIQQKWTPLMAASLKGHKHVAEVLVLHSADVGAQNKVIVFGMWLIYYKQHVKVSEELGCNAKVLHVHIVVLKYQLKVKYYRIFVTLCVCHKYTCRVMCANVDSLHAQWVACSGMAIYHYIILGEVGTKWRQYVECRSWCVKRCDVFLTTFI